MCFPKIGKMRLRSEGWFVANVMFSFINEDGEEFLSEKGHNIYYGGSASEDPGELGIPDGTVIALYAFVLWGEDNPAPRCFIYEQGNPECARYLISGTTLDNTLTFEGITT